MRGNNIRYGVQLCRIGDKARVNRCGIGNNPQAQAGRAAAICHRLAHVHGYKLADGAIAIDYFGQPAPNPGIFLRFAG